MWGLNNSLTLFCNVSSVLMLALSSAVLMCKCACASGASAVRGVYQQPAGVEADPPPVLLGADVDSLLPAGVAAGVPLRWPAVQGEPLVQGENTHADFCLRIHLTLTLNKDTFLITLSCKLSYHYKIYFPICLDLCWCLCVNSVISGVKIRQALTVSWMKMRLVKSLPVLLSSPGDLCVSEGSHTQYDDRGRSEEDGGGHHWAL